ncbi:hypothetical protein ATER59S_05604 [Aquamicrobium terrae]
MCGFCGFPSAPGHWTEAGSSATAYDRLRARYRRADLLKSILPAQGLTAHDDMQTPGICVGTFSGNQVIAANLAEVWEAAERLSGRVFDPLDPAFLDGGTQDGGER